MQASDFGEKFTWGVSSSAYQTEGAYLDDGKGLSIWDVFTGGQSDKIKFNQNAQITCDFYNRYIQDLILMDFMNIRNFRFSIAWSRILPQGIGQLNTKGIDFYNRLIDFALECNIQPWVTLYHWDLPQALQEKGGWANREILNWFTDYTETCIKYFGDRVKNWMVLNEPIVFTGAGHFLGIHAPGKKGLSNFLPAVHHATLCQSLGAQIIKYYQPLANVGTTFSLTDIQAADASIQNVEAAKRTDALINRLFIEPLIGLGYPWQDLPILKQLEKYMHPKDEQLMRFDFDFIGVQNYTREVVRHTHLIPYLNARTVLPKEREVPMTNMNWEIYPKGMYRILKKLHSYNAFKNFIITENGAAFSDHLDEGKIVDNDRIRFIESYLEHVLKAKQEGVPVNGYFVWSFTDNFEWAEGFRQRFGLVYIDYPTQKRIIKKSGYWYQEFLKEHQNKMKPCHTAS